jgi:ubiquinone/menaquinone biosynthesis C-methylase UbiE
VNAETREPSTAEATKVCCADLYASDWIRLLLGDSFHPGGLALTERLGTLLGLDASSRVLDVAAGPGTSALHLARVFGCRVVGVDLGVRNVTLARQAADQDGLADRVQFIEGDAEDLRDFAEGSFDAVVCECAYCTFPNKAAAARQMARVLRPGGRLGLSDLTRSGPLPTELDGLLARVACIADAQPIAGYVRAFGAAGLRAERVESHDEVLAELVRQIRGRLLGAELLTKLARVELPSEVADVQQAKILAHHAARAVQAGLLGYGVLAAIKPFSSASAY